MRHIFIIHFFNVSLNTMNILTNTKKNLKASLHLVHILSLDSEASLWLYIYIATC